MFIERLKQLRTASGITQSALAQAFSVAQSTVGMWESGRREPDFDTLQGLAHFFGVTSDYLLGHSDIPNPQELTIPDELKNVPVAFHRGEFEDLTQEEVDALAKIAAGYKMLRK